MIYIIHGENYKSSRNFLFDKKNKEVLNLNALDVRLDELKQVLTESELFGGRKIIVIENLFEARAKKNFKEIIDLLNKAPDNLEIYLYSNKKINLNPIKSLKDRKVIEYKFNQNIFSFLDNLSPKSKKNLTFFHEVLNITDVNIIFYMLVRQFRLLLNLTNSSSSKNIDEIKRLAPWQKSKLTSQAKLFGEEKLKIIYNKLYKIDKNTKTGKSKLTLTQNIDILMLEI